MPLVREQVKKKVQKKQETVPEETQPKTKTEKHDKAISEIDELLDEIDEILEDEALAQTYIQMGGE